MTEDWLLRSGDGKNLKNSSKNRIWGISSKHSFSKGFLREVKPGDRLWFVKNKSKGKILAVATYRSHNSRELGPLIDISLTNKQLGWTGSGDKWSADIEIHYSNLYGLTDCELFTGIVGPCGIRKYNEKCSVNLALEYSYIMRYSKVTVEL